MLALLATLVIVAAWAMFLRPGALGGPATYVIVSGTSMEPGLQSNDLVVAFDQRTYSVGDVVVYRVPGAEAGAGTHIVHRIVGGDPHRGFVVKGDSREGPDHWEPSADEILGKMQLNVPRVGSALVFMRTPGGMSLIAGLTTILVALGAFSRPPRNAVARHTTPDRRRRRRRRRRGPTEPRRPASGPYGLNSSVWTRGLVIDACVPAPAPVGLWGIGHRPDDADRTRPTAESGRRR